MQDCASQESLELEPIELDHSQITLTPVTKGLIRQEVQDILDDFMLGLSDGEGTKKDTAGAMGSSCSDFSVIWTRLSNMKINRVM